MSQQGPILVVANDERPSFAAALDEAKMFPVVDLALTEAASAVTQLRPAVVLVGSQEATEPGFEALAKQIAAIKPYLPLIAVDPLVALPENAIPFAKRGGQFDRLMARLRAALRVRSLDATVLRRRKDGPKDSTPHDDIDPVRDATVLLIGRGAMYPLLSVALGERTGLVGALSMEAAAKHLNVRDIDGIVLGDGFTPRVVDVFLTVLAENARFRNLPVVLTSSGLAASYDLPNLEIISGEPERVAANALPLIRQHALEAHLARTLRAIDAGGLLDARSGLLTELAFDRDLVAVVDRTQAQGGALSVARFAYGPSQQHALFDGARILSRLMRQMDFGAVRQDGSVIVAFAETDLRAAHGVARRLVSVIRHTSHCNNGGRCEPAVTLATLLPSDTAPSLLARLCPQVRRTAM